MKDKSKCKLHQSSVLYIFEHRIKLNVSGYKLYTYVYRAC